MSEIYSDIKNKIQESDKYAFFSCLISGYLLYNRWISGWIINPDSIWNGLFYKPEYEWENSLGRVGLQAFGALKGYFVLPSLTALVCILFNSVIAVLLCRLFEIRHRELASLTGIVLSCSPSFCSLMTYYYTSDAYMFACICAVLFVLFLKKGGIFNYLLAVIVLLLSLTLYQAYLGTAICCSFFFIILYVLSNKFSSKDFLKLILRFLSAGIIACLLYIFLYKLYCLMFSISPVIPIDTSGFHGVSIKSLFLLIKDTYRSFADYYLTSTLFSHSFMFWGRINLLMFFLLYILILLISLKTGSNDKIIITICLLILLPLAVMSISIYAYGASDAYGTTLYDVTGILMVPHLIFINVFALAIIQIILNRNYEIIYLKYIGYAIVCLLICVSSIQMIYTQIFASTVEKDIWQADSISQMLITRLTEMPEYSENKKIAVIGNYRDGNFPDLYPELHNIVKGTAAADGCFWPSINGNEFSWINYLKQFKGFDCSPCSKEEIMEIMNTDEFRNMEIFPAGKSIKQINNIVVVKMS